MEQPPRSCPPPFIVSTTITDNKEKIILEALGSVVDVVDRCVVVDTGITDKTLHVARARCRDKLVTVRHAWGEDFSAARNAALEAAAATGARWAVTVDTDERLEWRGLDLRGYLEGLPEDVAVVDVRDARGHYPKERIFRLPARGSWGERVHEAFTPAGRRVEAPSVRFRELGKTAEEARKKDERDERVLREEVARRPDHGRSWYYLGQILEYQEGRGRREEAVEAFRRCFHESRWDEEAAWAAYRASVVLVGLEVYEEALMWCARGMTRHAAMAELPWHAAWICHEKKRDEVQALRWALLAQAINEREPLHAEIKRRIGFSYPLALHDGPHDIARRALEGLSRPEDAARQEKLRVAAERTRLVVEGAAEGGGERPPTAEVQPAGVKALALERGHRRIKITDVKKYDVIFADGAGDSYDHTTPDRYALGGSELEVVLLAEELAREGYQILVLNRAALAGARYTDKEATGMSVSPAGVTYGHLGDVVARSCHVLVPLRYTPASALAAIRADRVVRWCHDASPDAPTFKGQGQTIVCVSRWQAERFFAHSDAETIPNMLPREVLHAPQKETKTLPLQLVYASGVVKGLDATLEAWGKLRARLGPRLRARVELHVYTPAWSARAAGEGNKETQGIVVHGPVPLPALILALRHSRGLFYVNTFPETFCNVAAMCEALGRRVHVYCAGDSPGGLPSTLSWSKVSPSLSNMLDLAQASLENERDARIMPLRYPAESRYHPGRIAQRWIDLLELDKPRGEAIPHRFSLGSGDRRSAVGGRRSS